MRHRSRKIGLFLTICLSIIGCGEDATAQIDAPFVALSGVYVGSVAADVASTVHALSVCRDCREANPLARPFFKSPVLGSAFVVGTTVGTLWFTHRLRQTKVGRKIWWLIPVSLTALHTYATLHNMGIREPPASIGITLQF